MRSFIIAGLIAATLTPVAAQAQSAGELRRDRQDIREERRDVRQAVRNGAGPREIRNQRRDVREARAEYREDWRDYRRSNPGVFRGPAYVGPRGYSYRPIAPGYRFNSSYYDRRYWLDAPRYRLPAPGYNRRWIRYGRDAALVDIRNGNTISVYGSFFF